MHTSDSTSIKYPVDVLGNEARILRAQIAYRSDGNIHLNPWFNHACAVVTTKSDKPRPGSIKTTNLMSRAGAAQCSCDPKFSFLRRLWSDLRSRDKQNLDLLHAIWRLPPLCRPVSCQLPWYEINSLWRSPTAKRPSSNRLGRRSRTRLACLKLEYCSSKSEYT